MTAALFAGFAAMTLGCGWVMLRTMSMLKAGIALIASSLGVAGLLVLLHADLLAAMTVMMFGTPMMGMVVFMLMLMEDSGGFMMTSREAASPPAQQPDAEQETLRASDGLLRPITAIAPATREMDMAMTNTQERWGAVLAIVFFVVSAAVVTATPWRVHSGQPDHAQALLVGSALLGKYMMAFEGAGLLILMTMVGATVLGRRSV